ncbi:MAG: autotransporter-associated beta strand repeat-containing protein [Thermoguttaceae bacterium]
MSRCHSLLIGVLAVSLLLAGRLSAATVTWDGDTSSDFEAGANWVGNSAPANNNTADTATFGTIGTSTQPALSTSRSVLGTNFTVAGWTLSGPHTLTLGSGGIDSAGSGTNSVTTSGLVLSANSTWTVGADNRLSVNSNVSGTGSLTKDGAGELLLAGANTHTGATHIAAGTLTLAADNALSASSHLTLGSSGTLRLNGHDATLYGVNGDTSTAGSAIVNGVSTDPVTLTLSCASGNFSYYRGSIGR